MGKHAKNQCIIKVEQQQAEQIETNAMSQYLAATKQYSPSIHPSFAPF